MFAEQTQIFMDAGFYADIVLRTPPNSEITLSMDVADKTQFADTKIQDARDVVFTTVAHSERCKPLPIGATQ